MSTVLGRTRKAAKYFFDLAKEVVVLRIMRAPSDQNESLYGEQK